MATYKKKDKVKKANAPINELENQSTTAEVFKTLDESANRSEQFIEKYQKPLLFAFAGIFGAILLFFAYNRFIQEPSEKEAANELAFPKAYFEQAEKAVASEKDSLFTLSLEGSNGKYGFIDIAKTYSSTNAGNLANYYAGIAYKNIKDYEKAIEYLNNFSSDDVFLGSIAIGAIGDCFADLNQLEDALTYYKKAAYNTKNEATTPFFLNKAGQIALLAKNYEEALSLFEEIKSDYPENKIVDQINASINKAKFAMQ